MLQLVRCTNRSTSNKEIQFHKVPSADKDSNLRKQWLHKIRREGKLPNDKSFYICSDHFQDECYQRDLEVSLVKEIYPVLTKLCNELQRPTTTYNELQRPTTS